jgi:hypothetical protein
MEHLLFHWEDITELLIDDIIEEEVHERNIIEKLAAKDLHAEDCDDEDDDDSFNQYQRAESLEKSKSLARELQE